MKERAKEEGMMEAKKLIKKYGLRLAKGARPDGSDAVRCPHKTAMKAVQAAGRDAILAELYEIEAKQKADREDLEAQWAAKRKEQDAKDEIELVKMRTEAKKLRAQIPAGAIEVKATQTGSLDGDPILKYEAEGTEIPWDLPTRIGWASAIRPGALNSFASEYIGYITPEKLNEYKAKIAEAKQAKEDAEVKAATDLETKKNEALAEAKRTGKNVYVRTVGSYDGDVRHPGQELGMVYIHEMATPKGTLIESEQACY